MYKLLTIISVLIAVSFFTLAERKLLGSVQRRKGPNVVGFWGILQAFADGFKLIFKEIIIPMRANRVYFCVAPMFSFLISLVLWCFIPFSELDFLVNFDYSLLWVYAFSSIGVYGIIGAGWASNSKYALIGGIRSAAQLVSYEVFILLLLSPVAACSNSFNLIEIVRSQQYGFFFIPLFPVSVIFFIAILAETNRAPFDLPEAESELVAGYNVEYSSITFALFFFVWI